MIIGFETDIEEFKKQISTSNLEGKKLNLLNEIIDANFSDGKQDNLENSYMKSEKFRQDSTTRKNGRSLDSSMILSNISLNEVFERNTTDKKNMYKSMNDTHAVPEENIILEEDSNLNLNTLNFRSNFNPCSLQFANELEQNNINETYKIDEDLLLILERKKSNRKSSSEIEISKLSQKIDSTEGLVFYRLLLLAQEKDINLIQNKPFDKILIKY